MIDFYDFIELVSKYKHYVFLLSINYNTKRWAMPLGIHDYKTTEVQKNI